MFDGPLRGGAEDDAPMTTGSVRQDLCGPGGCMHSYPLEDGRRGARGAWAGGVLFTIALLTCTPRPGFAGASSDEALLNPGGELAATEDAALPGWTPVMGTWAAARSGFDGIEPIEGERFFASNGTARAHLVQRVSVDGRGRSDSWVALLRASLCDKGSSGGQALELVALDLKGRILARATTGFQHAETWAHRALALRLPPRTMSLSVEVVGLPLAERPCRVYVDAFELSIVDSTTLAPLAAEGFETLQRRRRASDKARPIEYWTQALALMETDARAAQSELLGDLEACRSPRERSTVLTALALAEPRHARALFREALESEQMSDEERHGWVVASEGIDPLPAELLERGFLSSNNGDLRNACLEALLGRLSTRDLDPLHALYRKSDDERQAEILRLLSRRRVPDDCFDDFLAPNLTRDSDPIRRDLAMEQLSRSQDPRFFTRLEKLLPAVRSPATRMHWIAQCGRFQGIEAFRRILRIAEQQEQLFGEPIEHLLDEELHLRPDRSPERDRLRWTILGMLATLDRDVARRWALEEGARSKLAVAREGAVQVFARREREGDLERLCELARDEAPEVAVAVAEALAEGPEDQVLPVLRGMVESGELAVARSALSALWSASLNRSVALEVSRGLAAQASEAPLRADALGRLLGDDAIGLELILLENLGHDSEDVRMAACAAIASLRTVDSIETLLAQLDEVEGSETHKIAHLLHRLTGRNWGPSADRWMEWWEGVREGYRVRAEPFEPEPTEGGRTRAYWGIPIEGNSIVFLIDLSGSMDTRVDRTTRLRKAQDKLIETLRGLDESMRFNILVFSSLPGTWRYSLQTATPEVIEDAVEWVDRLKKHPLQGGGTNLFDSLELALNQEGVDTVFLLTDGAASTGRWTFPEDVREQTRLENRYRRVRIHTIGIDTKDRAAELLSFIAEDNRGTYVQR